MIGLALVVLARADVVFPTDLECPPGSAPVTAHIPYCEPLPCTERCEVECRPVGLCLLEHHGTWMPDHPWVSVEGCCASQADCGAGAVCTVEDRCVSGDLDERCVPADDGRGCGTAASEPPVVAFLASLTLLALRRRRSA